MGNSAKVVLSLTACALKGVDFDTTEYSDVDWDKVYEIAKTHSILSLVARCVLKIKDLPDSVKGRFNNELLLGIFTENNQRTMTDIILKEFENEGIDAMTLKGSVLRYMYPSADMRSMGDIDVLIRTSDYEKAKSIMDKNGFAFAMESAHEYIFSNPKTQVTVELHKLLVPDYNKTLISYYGDGWKLAEKEEGYNHRYKMRDEDFYIYNIVHSAKHYLNAGIGIRQVADLYVMMNNDMYRTLDKEYVNEKLEMLGISEFYENLVRLCGVWFMDYEGDDITDIMGEHILNSGVFGTTDDKASSRAYRETVETNLFMLRMKKTFFALFPKPKDIKRKYKKLEKYPVLYPFYIVYRWFDALFNRKDRININLKHIAVSKEDIKTFGDHCEAVGLKKTL